MRRVRTGITSNAADTMRHHLRISLIGFICCFAVSFRFQSGAETSKLERFPLFARPAIPAAAEGEIPLSVTAINFKLTPSIEEYVFKKFGAVLQRLGGGRVQRAEVRLKIARLPPAQGHTRLIKRGLAQAAVTMRMNGQPLVTASGNADDMYSAILLTAHRAARALRERKERVKYMRLVGARLKV